jgi:hypothetical protein
VRGDPDVLVIRSLRSRAFLLLLLAPIMIGMSVFLALSHPYLVVRLFGWFGTAFFSLSLVAISIRLLRPDVLTLTVDGFTLRDWKQTQRIPWQNVKEFFVWSGYGAGMASWVLHDSARRANLMARVNRPFGLDGSIGINWPHPPERMAELLSEWKERHAPESHPNCG